MHTWRIVSGGIEPLAREPAAGAHMHAREVVALDAMVKAAYRDMRIPERSARGTGFQLTSHSFCPGVGGRFSLSHQPDLLQFCCAM